MFQILLPSVFCLIMPKYTGANKGKKLIGRNMIPLGTFSGQSGMLPDLNEVEWVVKSERLLPIPKF
jgi:hypothetical protein